MTIDLPTLSAADLRAEIQRLRKGLAPIVLLGRTAETNVFLDGEATPWTVASATCELALRELLAAHDSQPLVVTIDFSVELPLDIEGRIAGQRAHLVDRGGRLIRLLCPQAPIRLEASTELLSSKIARALLSGAPVRPLLAAGPTLGLDAAWRSFLAAAAGLPPEGPLTLDRLLEFVAGTPPKAAIGHAWSQFAGLREEFNAWLRGSAGKVALAVWDAWEHGRGQTVAALSVILEAMAAEGLAKDPYLRGWMAAPLQIAGLGNIHAEELPIWAAAATTLLQRNHGNGLFRQLIDSADRLVQDNQARHKLGLASRFLPSAVGILQAELARVLDACRCASDPSGVDEAGRLLRQLRNHWQRDEDCLNRADHALRLLCWWWSEMPEPTGPLHLQAGAWAAWYAKDGGFVDLARRRLRGMGRSELDLAMGRLLAAVDERRDRMDQRFAEAAVAWQQAGRPLGEGIPIEMALDVIAVHFLRGTADRRLLVVVLDGAPWSVATELLLDMQTRDWAPLRWRPPQFAEAPQIAVLADLPTLTEVSRAALFAGSRVAAGPKVPTSKDSERFSRHHGLAGLETRAGGPQLLLKGELQSSSGSLCAEGARLIASDARVAACVLNAFDDDLDGALQVRNSYTVDAVPLLGQLLQAAFGAGRAVLLVADHGHVPGDRMSYQASPSTEGGGRWRALMASDELQPGEIALSKQHAWVPSGFDRVALLSQETSRYSRSAAAGEHGGIALAEMVAPAMLVGDAELESRAVAAGDDALALKAPHVPAWWRLEAEQAVQDLRSVVPSRPAKPKPKPKPAEPLLPLAELEAAAVRPTPVGGPRSSLVAQVAQSPVLQALPDHQKKTLQDKVLPWLDILVTAGGKMSTERFAQAAGLLPSRVAGAASTMGELLGLDGYQPVSFDGVAQQLSVHEDILRQLYVEG